MVTWFIKPKAFLETIQGNLLASSSGPSCKRVGFAGCLLFLGLSLTKGLLSSYILATSELIVKPQNIKLWPFYMSERWGLGEARANGQRCLYGAWYKFEQAI